MLTNLFMHLLWSCVSKVYDKPMNFKGISYLLSRHSREGGNPVKSSGYGFLLPWEWQNIGLCSYGILPHKRIKRESLFRRQFAELNALTPHDDRVDGNFIGDPDIGNNSNR